MLMISEGSAPRLCGRLLTEQRHSTQGSSLEENFWPSSYVLDSYSHGSQLQVAQATSESFWILILDNAP